MMENIFAKTLLMLLGLMMMSSCEKEELDDTGTNIKVEKPLPPSQKERYVVKYRSLEDEEWKPLEVRTAMVDVHKPRKTYFTQVCFASPIEVMVRFRETIRNVKIRPFSKNIEFTQEGDSIFFKIEKPSYLSLEFNGDKFGNLQFFADEPIADLSSETNTVIQIPSGYHDNYNGKDVLNVGSNTTVVLEEGSVISFPIHISNAENVKIIGPGIIKKKQYYNGTILIEYSKNILVDGPTVVNDENYSIFGGQSDNIEIRNFKCFSPKYWADGIDLMSCNNVKINNVYLRTSDDCIAFYGHRWVYNGDSDNIKVSNAVLWADMAHPINIGTHGAYENNGPGNVLSNYSFNNIDVLEHHEVTSVYKGCFAINCGDNNIVRDLLFENIRIENIEEGKLFSFMISLDPAFNVVPGQLIENVTIRNVSYVPTYPEWNNVDKAVIKGYDSGRRIKNINIENFLINGERLTMDDIDVNEYVDGLVIK